MAKSGSGARGQGAGLGRLAVIVVATAAGLLALGFGLVFAKLTESVLRGDDLPTVDARITTWLVGHRDATLTAVLRPVTHLADPVVITAVLVVAAVILILWGRRRAAAFVLVSSVGTALLVQVVKLIIGRARPATADRLVSVTGAAFPSGHAAQSVACYLALAVVVAWLSRSRSAWLAAVVAASLICLLVGVSRVYLGVHWASDVIAGWSLGAAWLAGTVAVFAVAGWVDHRT